MAPKNPLKEDKNPQEVVDGGSIVNLTTQETVEVILEDGSTATIVTGEINSGKGSEGQYVRKRKTFVRVNPLGNSVTIDPANPLLLPFGSHDYLSRTKSHLYLKLSQGSKPKYPHRV